MGTLKDFSAYINRCLDIVKATRDHVLKLQQHYETLFQEVVRVRDEEFNQARVEITNRRGNLPYNFDEVLAQTAMQAEKDFDAKLQNLRSEREAVIAKAAQFHQQSIEFENELRRQNVDLDAKEEALKTRNEQLLAALEQYNQQLKQMGTGFGFFLNLFEMRKLRKQRAYLDQEHEDVAARIESLRHQWAARQQQHGDQQQTLRAKWLEAKTTADELQTKIELLMMTKPTVIERTTLERALFYHFPQPTAQGVGEPCPRCAGPNPDTNSFCHYCALRLKPDRPDLEGSLPEIAELNSHFERFLQGMTACQQLIGLVQGLISGLEAFHKSVKSMMRNERKYPIPKLRIDVPAESIAFASYFQQLQQLALARAAHPIDLAATAEQAMEIFDVKALDTYFDRMGRELTLQAERQWK